MPRLNRTGPRGLGPMTGGGFGLCAGLPTSYMPYNYRQYTMPSFPSTYPAYLQNPYEFQNQTVSSMQQPYYGGSPFGWGLGRGLGAGRGLGFGLEWGRGFGIGMAYRRGMGWVGRGAYPY